MVKKKLDKGYRERYTNDIERTQQALVTQERLEHMSSFYSYYSREVDCGRGRQNVEVVDGIVTRQWLVSRDCDYTGDGNPELVGKTQKEITRIKTGFSRKSGPLAFNSVTQKWYCVHMHEKVFLQEE